MRQHLRHTISQDAWHNVDSRTRRCLPQHAPPRLHTLCLSLAHLRRRLCCMQHREGGMGQSQNRRNTTALHQCLVHMRRKPVLLTFEYPFGFTDGGMYAGSFGSGPSLGARFLRCSKITAFADFESITRLSVLRSSTCGIGLADTQGSLDSSTLTTFHPLPICSSTLCVERHRLKPLPKHERVWHLTGATKVYRCGFCLWYCPLGHQMF